MKQYTVEICTDKGYDILVLEEEPNDLIVKETFDQYRNDEAGKHFEDARLLSWSLIGED